MSAIDTEDVSKSVNLKVEELHDAVEEDVAAADTPQNTQESTAENPHSPQDEFADMPDPEALAPEPWEDRDAEPAVATAPVRTETVVERKGGFIPLVFGGLIAAGIGFGAAYYVLPDLIGKDQSEIETSLATQLEAQSSEINALTGRLDNLPPPADLTRFEAAQGEISATLQGLSDRIAGLEARLGEMDARITDAERRPLAEGASDAAVAAYEQELKALQDAMAAQRAEIEAMMAEAESAEENAAQSAEAAMRRAALTRIQTALDAGTGFSQALSDLEAAGVTAPDALRTIAEQGVSSLAELQEAFPEVARAALAASRRAAAGSGEESGFSSFLKNQLGARSLEPREGDDPDAILSRAEAAAREGRLTDALAEIETLPEEGRAETMDWVAKAAERLEVVAAAEALGRELN